jgi:hypothetical protein
MKYSLYECFPGAFLVSCDNAFDLAMLFLRAEEFYENPQFKDKTFSILDFISWYSKEIGDNSFSYPIDFVGFNIPSEIIEKCYEKHSSAGYDENEYDRELLKIISIIKKKMNGERFYLLGMRENDLETMKHEVAHAFYYLNDDYRDEMKDLTFNLPSNIKEKFCSELLAQTYDASVHYDEMQAYLATGLSEEFEYNNLYNKFEPQFQEAFNKYYSEIQMKELNMNENTNSISSQIVRLPDHEGWWVRKCGKNIEMFYVVEIDDIGTKRLSIYISDIMDFVEVSKFSSPLTRWFPVSLPEEWVQ